MIRERENIILLPKKKPQTLGEVLEWHKGLLSFCLECELERQVIKSSISKINQLIRETTPYMEDKEFPNAAKLQLESLNGILRKAREDVEILNETIRTIYKTNDTIITGILASYIGQKKIQEEVAELKEKYKGCHPNLLHGIGWMFEYECAKYYWDKGIPAFITFGTLWDAAATDVIATLLPLDTKVEFNI